MAAIYQTLSDVFADVRFNTEKDSTTLLDADLYRLANKYYRRIIRELVDLNEDFYAEISYTDLVANQREYILPVDATSGTYGGGLQKLQRVEITYDGTNWKVVSPVSLQEMAGPTILDADLNTMYSVSNPAYWFKDRSVWLAPVPSSSDSVAGGNAGLRIYWIKRPGELAGSSDIPDISPDFLSLLTEGMLIDVFRKIGRLGDMDRAERRFETGLSRMKQLEQSPDQEQPYMLKTIKKSYK